MLAVSKKAVCLRSCTNQRTTAQKRLLSPSTFNQQRPAISSIASISVGRSPYEAITAVDGGVGTIREYSALSSCVAMQHFDISLRHSSSISATSSGVLFSSAKSLRSNQHDVLTSAAKRNYRVGFEHRSLGSPNRSTPLSHSRGGPSSSSWQEDNQLFYNTLHNIISRAAFSSSTNPPSSGGSTDNNKGGPTSLESKLASPTSSSPSSSTSVSTGTPSSPSVERSEKKSMTVRAKDMTVGAIKAIVNILLKTPGVLWFYMTHPKEFRDKLIGFKEAAKKEAHHYWMGSKLLAADLRTARKITMRSLHGSALTRRERKQLLRTTSDLFRLVPMSMFLIIPFMEFALPFALKLFPNMLPSTFQDSLKAEENMKRELQSRLAMTSFFQETLQDMAKEQKKRATRQKKKKEANSDEASFEIEKEETAAAFLEFLESARQGTQIPPDVIIRYAHYFEDEMTLDNMPRMQLINMCRYMNLTPYGADSFLRFQLRHKIRTLKEDDQRILWEGIDSLTKMELREACQERGMRSTGLSKEAYKYALQQWLELSVDKKVPHSLLIMSRTFFLKEEMISRNATATGGTKSLAGLAEAISGFDKEIVNEIVLSVATSEEKKSNADVMKIKLEVLEQQNELILEEQQEREAAARKKEEAKEKEELERQQKEEAAKAESDGETAAITRLMNEAAAEKVDGSDKAKEEKQTDTTAKEGGGEWLDESLSQKAKDAVALEAKEEKESENVETLTSDDIAGSTDDEKEKETSTLSFEEMQAIKSLLSPDPVESERAELARIKAAMMVKEEAEAQTAPSEPPSQEDEAVESEEVPLAESKDSAPMTSEEADKEAANAIAEMDETAKLESEASTVTDISTTEVVAYEEEEVEVEDEALNHAIARLQSKIGTMLDKIEIQISDVQLKIGDKFHLLDKDMDGVLSMEEMAECLQSVLKRELTSEEAMAIAADMDENEDGFFTVAELLKWVETNKLVRLVENGRDAEVDAIIARSAEKRSAEKLHRDVDGEQRSATEETKDIK